VAATGDNGTAGETGDVDLYDAANPPFAGLPEPLTSRSAREEAAPPPEERWSGPGPARIAAVVLVLLFALLMVRRRRRARRDGAR
jgi:MYXO-CTERM domain-containing protein